LATGWRVPSFTPSRSRKRLNVFGFYDLRLTPLATIFKFFVKLNFFFGFFGKKRFSDYYFFNKRSLTRGFLVPYLVHEKKNWGTFCDPLNYFIIPLFTFFPELLFTFIFTFFLRPLFYWYFSFVGRLFFKYEKKISLFDHFWVVLYGYYLDDVSSFLRIIRLETHYRLRLRYFSYISNYFYFRSISFSKYWRRRFYHLFSEYGTFEFIFSKTFALSFYKYSEHDKMTAFKDMILLDSRQQQILVNPVFLPDPGFFFTVHFKNRYFSRPFFYFWGFTSLKKLRSIPIFSSLSPYYDKNYIRKFYSVIFMIVVCLSVVNNPQNIQRDPVFFRRYKTRSRWFIRHFQRFWPTRLYYFLTFKRSFFEGFFSANYA
jgi:hypothetical protein